MNTKFLSRRQKPSFQGLRETQGSSVHRISQHPSPERLQTLSHRHRPIHLYARCRHHASSCQHPDTRRVRPKHSKPYQQHPKVLIGEEVEVLHVGQGNGRRELIATCQCNGRRYEVSLLDINLDADPATSRLLAAYRRWARA